MWRYFPALTTILSVVLLAACSNSESPDIETTTIDSGDTTAITTVNNPLYYFTQQLADDLAIVKFPVPADIDPSQWKPNLDQVLQLQESELIILNGAGYSSWLDKVSLSSSRLVNTSVSNNAQWIPLNEQTTHSHGPDGEHSHSGYAFTTWMDMNLAKQQAKAIASALRKRWPNQGQAIAQRETELLNALEALDHGYSEQARRLADKTLIYSHPVYQYFERRYQLTGHSLHWEPDEVPDEQQWTQLKTLIKGKKNVLFVWEDFPVKVITDRMNSLGLEYVVIRPAANRGDIDWLSEQQVNLQRLQSSSPLSE